MELLEFYRAKLCVGRVLDSISDYVGEPLTDEERKEMLSEENIGNALTLIFAFTTAITKVAPPYDKVEDIMDAEMERAEEELGDILNGRVCPPEKAKMEEGS